LYIDKIIYLIIMTMIITIIAIIIFARSHKGAGSYVGYFGLLKREVDLINANTSHLIQIGRSATTEIARIGDHYAVQGHSRSLISITIESPCATSYQ